MSNLRTNLIQKVQNKEKTAKLAFFPELGTFVSEPTSQETRTSITHKYFQEPEIPRKSSEFSPICPIHLNYPSILSLSTEQITR